MRMLEEELGKGADMDIKKITIRDLLVRPDCTLTISRKFKCDNLEVLGDLKAKVTVTGVVTVRPGGTLRGAVCTPHLIVEDGGGLSATISAGIEQDAKVTKKTRRKSGAH